MTRRLNILAIPLLLVACGAPAAPEPPSPEPVADEPLGRPARTDETPTERERERERVRERERIAREDSIRHARAQEEALRLEEAERAEREAEEAAAAAAAAEERSRDRPVRRERPALPVLPGAVLPRERIIAFYGNPLSTRMGILGELPPDEMLGLLDREVAAWRAADPGTPAVPALHLIAVMAAGDPGPDSLYRIRLPDRHVERVLDWAERRDALLFLDIQTGLSDVAAELPRLRKWLTRPEVHLALDPEWNMPGGARPGTRIGTMSAAEVNHAIEYLAELVTEHRLPPKVLVVHRFTSAMLRNAEDIRLDPRVQVVINMDGWGPPAQKIQAYRDIVAPEAYQYTGFKLFYKNDLKGGSRLMTPAEILSLDPEPVYIQYQ
ncbi:MAG: hypothetical protein KY466_04805 [Gemmatimonadetes bacterium]|nr:hypothetical protein [Gemmatimonadota bacterium]